MLKLSDFDYYLPKELIAQYPNKKRDAARLLVLERKTKKIEHKAFSDLVDYFQKDDLLVLNDSKVLPARLFGKRKTGGKVEVLLLKYKSGLIFDALISPTRVKLQEEIIFNSGKISAKLTGRNEITFSALSVEDIYAHGVMPLPPYIKRQAEDLDNIYYQTVFAKNDGSIAAPTAGLHFSEELLKEIEFKGARIAYVTLHVGEGTFKPVKCEDITLHKMHAEYFSISDTSIGLVEQARKNKRKILSVGTTSLRTLETYARGKKSGDTDLFIYPKFEFKIANGLLTNFHLPKTTLFMLVCAFAGEDLAKKAYAEAVREKYNFYSYGDAMLII